jgi:hypothetical protein
LYYTSPAVAGKVLLRSRGQPDQPETGHDFSDAKQELNAFLAARAYAIERRELRESARLRAEVAGLREENARLTARLRAEQQPQQPPANNVISIDDAARSNSTKPPARYLKHREPWDDGGAIVAPAWLPD